MATDIKKIEDEIAVLEKEIQEKRERMEKLRRKLVAQTVNEYTFTSRAGKAVKLSSLFGDKDDLIVVHNMGTGCRYCTLWADGFNGEYQHLENRAGFVVVSPNKPNVVDKFASGRNWQFNILSADSTTFFKDMGFESEKGGAQPGVSTFHREKDGTIKRVSKASFGPGDMFCGVWHMLDMLKDGPNDWEPQYEYK